MRGSRSPSQLKYLKKLALYSLEQLRKGEIEGISSELISYLEEEGALRDGRIVSTKAAISLIKLGITPEEAASLLDWREFEQVCYSILEKHGYEVVRGLRFSVGGRRYELDLLACSDLCLLHVDCKMWSLRRGISGALARAAARHKERALAFSKCLSDLKGIILEPGRSRAIPILVCWLPAARRIIDGIPVIPLYALRSFLLNLDPLDDEIWGITLDYRVRLCRASRRNS